jgi:Na+/H+ antiporter NhaA
MSLFIGQLAFTAPEYVEQAKLGILLGSAISATLGLAWLYYVGSSSAEAGAEGK